MRTRRAVSRLVDVRDLFATFASHYDRGTHHFVRTTNSLTKAAYRTSVAHRNELLVRPTQRRNFLTGDVGTACRRLRLAVRADFFGGFQMS
jgi:hypothetical protein